MSKFEKWCDFIMRINLYVVLPLMILTLFLYHCTAPEKEVEVKKCSDFKDFSLAHWPNHLENECFPGMHNKCCNIAKNDKGGLTCYGVAIQYNHRFYKYLQKLGHDLNNLTPKKVRKIDSTTIEPYAKMKIYRNYYKGPRINELSFTGLKQVVFDTSVHAGPRRAVKILQEMCNIKQDGILGDKTIKKCRFYGEGSLSYTQLREKWLKTRPSWKINERGFIARLKRQPDQVIYAYKHSCK